MLVLPELQEDGTKKYIVYNNEGQLIYETKGYYNSDLVKYTDKVFIIREQNNFLVYTLDGTQLDNNCINNYITSEELERFNKETINSDNIELFKEKILEVQSDLEKSLDNLNNKYKQKIVKLTLSYEDKLKEKQIIIDKLTNTLDLAEQKAEEFQQIKIDNKLLKFERNILIIICIILSIFLAI